MCRVGAWIDTNGTLGAMLVHPVHGVRGATPRGRAVLCVGLALVLALFAFETGRHSVHHLARSHEAARCALASAAHHVAGVGAPAPVSAALLVVASDAPLDPPPAVSAWRAPGADLGRAPPASSSA